MAILFSCEKYVDQTRSKAKQNLDYSNSYLSGKYVIPADISDFNLYPFTKSENTDSLFADENFNLDSVLVWGMEEQFTYPDYNLLYRQIPINMNMGTVYCSISQNIDESLPFDSLSIVKSYYIIKEYMTGGEIEKFVVTMLPQSHQTEYNANCSYLDKPNYTGLIIYSDTDGKFQKIRRFENGLLIEGDLVEPGNINALDKINYIKIYQKAQALINTKSRDNPAWDDTLNSITVIGEKDRETKTEGKEESGGGGETPPPTPTPPDINAGEGGGGNSSEPTYYNLAINIDGGGSADGSGRYTANTNITIQAHPNNEYIFGGWSGDEGGLKNPSIVKMDCNKNITAHFYHQDSECGKLKKAIRNYDSLIVYRNKIKNNSLYEYGYTKSPNKSKIGKSLVNKLKTTTFLGITEMVHTHVLEFHLSLADLKTLYSTYARGYITDIENFTYAVVSPEYFVVLQIEDEEKMNDVINNVMIRSTDTNGVYRWDFCEYVYKSYYNYIPQESDKSEEEYFTNFMEFINDFDTGLSISVHKTDTTTKEVTSKYILDQSDFQDLINLVKICK